VQRAQRTHAKAFHEVTDTSFALLDIKLVKSYVEDLKTVLGLAAIIKQRAILEIVCRKYTSW